MARLPAAPSALNRQDMDIYVSMTDGLYLYNAADHNMGLISEGDIRHVTGTQKYAHNAPVNLVFVSDFSRFKRSWRDRREFYAAANAGFISQNVYLFCANAGLATVVRDSVDRSALAKAMNLRKKQKIILAQSVGYPVPT